MAGGPAGSVSSSRYPAIDVLRGLALISMVSNHVDDFSRSTLVGQVMHSARWIDGAFFFVALSGVVTGLVHRRVVERSGLYESAAKLVRRAGRLYLVHIALVLTIVTVHNADPSRSIPVTPTWSETGGLWSAVGQVVTLRLEPDFNTVLPMYVALLLWAVLVVSLLRRGRWWTVGAISVAVYVFGQTVDGLEITAGGFSIADWQLLFTAGLVVGWSWEHERALITPRWRRAIVGGAFALSATLYLSARIIQEPMESLFGGALHKVDGGWLAFIFAGAVLVAGYSVIDGARRSARLGRMMRPLEILGSKGLPGYAAMVISVLVLQFVPGMPRNDLMLIAVVIVCGAAEHGAMAFASRRPRRGTPITTGPAWDIVRRRRLTQ